MALGLGSGWAPTRIAGKSPFPRENHVAVEYMAKIFIWGGSLAGKDVSTDLSVLNTGFFLSCCFSLLFFSFVFMFCCEKQTKFGVDSLLFLVGFVCRVSRDEFERKREVCGCWLQSIKEKIEK